MKKSTLCSIIALTLIIGGVNTLNNRIVINEKTKIYSTVEEVVKDHLQFSNMKIEKIYSSKPVSESELNRINNALYQTSSNRFVLAKKGYSFTDFLQNNFSKVVTSYELEDLSEDNEEVMSKFYYSELNGLPNYPQPKEVIFKNLTLNDSVEAIVVIVDEGKGYAVDCIIDKSILYRNKNNEG